ncbi:MAG: ROK family protein [Gammaproteobacteria bacterium]|nr:ROK family protein [Gammaproteobacteria bacterium]
MRIGIDLGGTKIEAIALDEAGTVVKRRRVPTPKHDYPATLGAIVNLVRAFEAELAMSATVGVGIPGSLSPRSGLMVNANSTWCNGQRFDADLSAILEREIRVMNDANCLAVSEAVDGAAAGEAVVFAVILGTGVGGGIAINGRALVGRHAIAGEWGHNPLPWPEADEIPGPPCFCGRHGCIETFLSGPGFVRLFDVEADGALTPQALAAQAQAGDRAASAAWARYCGRLARALAHVINILDPDVIVLGGGLSNVSFIYQSVPGLLHQYVFTERCTTPLRQALHGDSSGVRGAAWLW